MRQKNYERKDLQPLIAEAVVDLFDRLDAPLHKDHARRLQRCLIRIAARLGSDLGQSATPFGALASQCFQEEAADNACVLPATTLGDLEPSSCVGTHAVAGPENAMDLLPGRWTALQESVTNVFDLLKQGKAITKEHASRFTNNAMAVGAAVRSLVK